MAWSLALAIDLVILHTWPVMVFFFGFWQVANADKCDF